MILKLDIEIHPAIKKEKTITCLREISTEISRQLKSMPQREFGHMYTSTWKMNYEIEHHDPNAITFKK